MPAGTTCERATRHSALHCINGRHHVTLCFATVPSLPVHHKDLHTSKSALLAGGLGLDEDDAGHKAHQHAGQVLQAPRHIEGHQANEGHGDLVQAAHQAVGGGRRCGEEPQRGKAHEEGQQRAGTRGSQEVRVLQSRNAVGREGQECVFGCPTGRTHSLRDVVVTRGGGEGIAQHVSKVCQLILYHTNGWLALLSERGMQQAE